MPIDLPVSVRSGKTHFGQGIENLRTLYSVMRGVPDEVVNLRHWRQTNGYNEHIDNDQLLERAQKIRCNTLACAVGWACAYPEFNEQGLHFEGKTPVLRGRAGSRYNWDAVLPFFELTQSEGFFLFLNDNEDSDYKPEGYVEDELTESSRTRVLRRIRAFLLAKGVITRERYDELAAEEAHELAAESDKPQSSTSV